MTAWSVCIVQVVGQEVPVVHHSKVGAHRACGGTMWWWSSSSLQLTAAERSTRHDPRHVARGAPVELGKDFTAQLRDRLLYLCLELGK